MVQAALKFVENLPKIGEGGVPGPQGGVGFSPSTGMATEENVETKGARYLTYSLLAGQHLLTLVTRIALPYIVAFISQEQQLSEQQRATLLSSFTAGYVWMQIPGGYLAERIGNKAICLINNVSVAALLLS